MTGTSTQFLNTNSVTYSKIQQVSAVSLLGNASASLANLEEITIGSSLNFSAAILNTIQAITTSSTPTFAGVSLTSTFQLTTSTTSGFVLTTNSSGVGTWQAPSAGALTLTGDVTGTGTGFVATTVASNAISYAKFQQVAASSLVGNPTGSTANAQGITLGTNLSFSGSVLNATGGGSSAANVAANDSNVTFTSSSNAYQICNPTAPRTYTLATTGIVSGYIMNFDNQSLFLITINSSGGNLVGYVYPSTLATFEALVATPTTAANWRQVNNSTQTLKGSISGSAPATGYIGEQISSTESSGTTITTSTILQDLTSISVTAGCWLISGQVLIASQSSDMAATGGAQLIISTTSGNSTSGTTVGGNRLLFMGSTNNTSGQYASCCIENIPANLSTTTTYYLKISHAFTATTNPVAYGNITAVRVG